MMPFHALPSLERGSQLTADYLSKLRENLRFVQAGFEAEHSSDGAHSVAHVPKLVLTFSGTTVYGDSGGVVSSVSESGGLLTFLVPKTLVPYDSGLPRGGVVVECCAIGSTSAGLKPIAVDGDAIPYGSTHTQINVRSYLLTSALGAGNTWGAFTGGRKSVAIYCRNARSGMTRYFRNPRAGDLVTNASGGVNGLVREIENLYDALSVGHSDAGVHTGSLFPSSAQIDYSGGSYSYAKEWGTSLGALSAPSTGRIYIAGAGGYKASARFVGDWASPSSKMSVAERTPHIFNAWDDGASARGAQCFYYDSGSWYTGRASGTSHGKLFVAEHTL